MQRTGLSACLIVGLFLIIVTGLLARPFHRPQREFLLKTEPQVLSLSFVWRSHGTYSERQFGSGSV
jgi:hypothetical protein